MICTDTDHYVNTLSTIKKEKKKKKKNIKQTPKSVLVLNYTETKVFLLPIEGGVTLFCPRYGR